MNHLFLSFPKSKRIDQTSPFYILSFLCQTQVPLSPISELRSAFYPRIWTHRATSHKILNAVILWFYRFRVLYLLVAPVWDKIFSNSSKWLVQDNSRLWSWLKHFLEWLISQVLVFCLKTSFCQSIHQARLWSILSISSLLGFNWLVFLSKHFGLQRNYSHRHVRPLI